MYYVSFLAIPGLIFAVNQDVIEYNDLTESSLQNFFSILEDNSPLLNHNGAANITGEHTTCTCKCIVWRQIMRHARDADRQSQKFAETIITDRHHNLTVKFHKLNFQD